MKRMLSIKKQLIFLTLLLLTLTLAASAALSWRLAAGMVRSSGQEKARQALSEIGGQCQQYFSSALQLLESTAMKEEWQEAASLVWNSSYSELSTHRAEMCNLLFYWRNSQDFFSTIILQMPGYLVFSSEYTQNNMSSFPGYIKREDVAGELVKIFGSAAFTYFPKDWESVPESMVLSARISKEMTLHGIVKISPQFQQMLKGYALYDPNFTILYNGMGEEIPLEEMTAALRNGETRLGGRTLQVYEDWNGRFCLVTAESLSQMLSGQNLILPAVLTAAAALCGWGLLMAGKMRRIFENIERLRRVFIRAEEKNENPEDMPEFPAARRSMHSRVMGMLSLTVIPLSVIVLCLTAVFMSAVMENEQKNWQESVERSVSQTEYALKNDLQFMRDLSRNLEVLEFMARGDAAAEMPHNMWTSTAFSGNIVSLQLYTWDWEILYSNGLMNTPVKPQERETVMEDYMQVHSFPTGPYGTDLKMIIAVRNPMRDAERAMPQIIQKIGFMEIKVQQPFFDFFAGWEEEGALGYVADQNGKLVFSGGAEETLTQQEMDYLRKEKQGDIWLEGERYHFYGRTISPVGYFMAALTPAAELSGKMVPMAVSNLALLSCMMLLCVITSYYIANLFVGNLIRIQRDIVIAGTGRRVEEDIPHNEFQVIHSAFRKMLKALDETNEQLRERERREMELERDKADAELSALEKQLSPHFLNNVFVSIRMLLNMGETKKADEMLKATSRLFRTSLYQNRSLIQVQEELEHARAYYHLQALRLEDQVSLEIGDMEDALRNLWIPKYTLQPLIENAIMHGLKSDEKLTISISFMRIGPTLEIVMENDGERIEEENMNRLNDMLREGQKGSRIGLMNIQKRIRLLFGEQWGMELGVSEEAGLRITVRLPALEEPQTRYGREGEGDD